MRPKTFSNGYAAMSRGDLIWVAIKDYRAAGTLPTVAADQVECEADEGGEKKSEGVVDTEDDAPGDLIEHH